MKVALVIGHSPKDKGAINQASQIQEFDYNQELVEKISFILNSLNISNEIVIRESYSVLPKQVNDTQADVAIEFHCNAFNESASGTEMLYWHTSKGGKRLAEICQKHIVECLGLSNRGAKAIAPGGRGANILQKTRMPCIISEPFFIDNDDDLKVGQDEIDRLAEVFVLSISEYVKGD